ncbi:hypothetical protein HZ326_29710 [Fusarium oxysporum f. sp. albedinis]|nr:hypothetical protein HZ326_29710 [Fusarium oxysporum f. sp. albedinis]
MTYKSVSGYSFTRPQKRPICPAPGPRPFWLTGSDSGNNMLDRCSNSSCEQGYNKIRCRLSNPLKGTNSLSSEETSLCGAPIA